MKIIPPNDLTDFILPLPIYRSIRIADAIGRDGEEFGIFVGLNGKCVEQLKKFSLDDLDVDLQNNTGDKKRFGEGLYEDWYTKSRTPFCLVHKQTDALAALVWFGPKSIGKKSIKFGEEEKDEIQNSWHTISCRSYIPFRGKGIMKNFTEFVMDVYKKQFSNINFWAGMDDRNKAVLKLFLELDFGIDEENSDLNSNWLIMTKK